MHRSFAEGHAVTLERSPNRGGWPRRAEPGAECYECAGERVREILLVPDDAISKDYASSWSAASSMRSLPAAAPSQAC